MYTPSPGWQGRMDRQRFSLRGILIGPKKLSSIKHWRFDWPGLCLWSRSSVCLCTLISSMLVNPLQTLGLALVAKYSSGRNHYATLSTLGFLKQFGDVHLPPAFEITAHP